ncbi:MAG TPA: lipid-binding SYLF domain-containing protein [Terriglobales bacterium]|nr:lipid-binding SYLF domain-containing protein [Terriglobales bacterium]
MIKKMLFVFSALLLVIVCFPGFAYAKYEGDRVKLQDRLEKAGTILNQITSAPDKGIPQEILAHAECVGVIPTMMKAGFGIGGEYGQGVVTCRTKRGWSAPAFYRLGGGTFGLQIGGEAVDLVMLFMNEHGVQSLLAHKVKLGADASASAGPVGRTAAADTNIALHAEILTYSRSRGVFAGVSLKGSWIEQNGGDTRTFYGRDINFRNILNGSIKPPQGSEGFLAAVRKDFGEARSAQ